MATRATSPEVRTSQPESPDLRGSGSPGVRTTCGSSNLGIQSPEAWPRNFPEPSPTSETESRGATWPCKQAGLLNTQGEFVAGNVLRNLIVVKNYLAGL